MFVRDFRQKASVTVWILLAAGLTAATLPASAQAPAAVALDPAKMARIGTVSERYQSYNIEMLEVTGGRFWAPYKLGSDKSADAKPVDPKDAAPGGMDPSLYRYRAPIDLSNPRLRKLAAALGPTYLRVSGTWANSTYFQDSDEPAAATPPQGFGGVLTRKEWKGVVDFSHAVNAEIVTSFAISPGVRNAEGVWTPVEAEKFLAYTKNAGGTIAAAEMFNEPTFAVIGGAPKGYDAAAYGKDFHAFDAFVKKAAPGMKVLGPGSIGEGGALGAMPGIHLIRSEDMMTAAGGDVDAFSYHFYGGVSKRCARPGVPGGTTPEAALSQAWLFRTDGEEAFYAGLRDRFTPGKPIWLTETGETACGGDPWAADFIDTFRYLNQLGTLAKHGVQVIMHNTLAASDYALIDESTLEPRPNYWGAVLWRRLMGTTVLEAGSATEPDLYLYAHCLRGHAGGVALLAINADRTAAKEITLPVAAERYSLTAPETSDLLENKVEMNGRLLKVGAEGALPSLDGVATKAGKVELAPASITFFGIAGAKNAACR